RPDVGSSSAQRVTFVESSVAGAETLLPGLAPQTDGVLLDATGDGITEMAAFLANRHDVTTVDIVAHGRPGAIELGTNTLDAPALKEATPALASIGAALATDGEIDLWSCYAALGSTGHAWINDLAAATRTNIAASDQAVGSTSAGGSWSLDVSVG